MVNKFTSQDVEVNLVKVIYYLLILKVAVYQKRESSQNYELDDDAVSKLQLQL
jgi:hypothetical protein